ncbi:hypothetical protein CCACVL1_10638 [Corchorus capsularis]|uniref:Uncharacterized protein n=1 Tax=Corchorus capsularis TaxID=210143 RepID=A0A1R3IQD6_COCAP|nr:hypothetical protein CCACVL1_10638 [Corchorus capsularis]
MEVTVKSIRVRCRWDDNMPDRGIFFIAPPPTR